MAMESHVPGQTGEACQAGGMAPVFAEKKSAEVVLRPVKRSDASEDVSGSPLQLSEVGSTGAAAADFLWVDRRYSERLGTGREQVLVHDGLGAIRGFVLVLGLYLVMGVMGLGGLMLWHWLR